ncbi:hypothetical protein CDD83_8007 [Cordyceps sp. RAO-2017]|nr:hypothetical protein CDD83_8007 [Cordyceps sp. RAO-2017]
MQPIQLDGTTGEGGGQLVRVAVGLAALTTQPVTITNVRGNRPGARGGGLKSQHVTSIAWLAEATGADVQGLSVGSKTLTFTPRRPPTELGRRRFRIAAESSAASTLLVLQAILPFVLFASNDAGEPVELEISGGTNVAWSLSFEYLDQVLMPTLEERFGITVERQLRKRGWSLGARSSGLVWFRVHPVPRGQTLQYRPPEQDARNSSDFFDVEKINVSIVVPGSAHDKLRETLALRLGSHFPSADVFFNLVEDSGADSRWSVLLVAHSAGGVRWATDVLCSMPRQAKSRDGFIEQTVDSLCRELSDEVGLGGTVDERLQDQLVSFQALAAGLSSFPRNDGLSTSTDVVDDDALVRDEGGNGKLRKERMHEPFGHGSGHAQTVRWVVGQLLPQVEFYNRGDFVRGVGYAIL